jgi:Tfp pilus assembly protein PilF
MQDSQTQLQMAAQYRQVGQSDVAEKLVVRVLTADPDSADALNLLGRRSRVDQYFTR